VYSNKNYFVAIKNYLLSKGWEELNDNARFFVFKAPKELGYINDSYIRIFRDIESSELRSYLIKMMDVASSHHKESYEDVKVFLPFNDNFFSLRIYDKDIIENTIALTRSKKILEFVEKFLKQVTEFTIEKSFWFEDRYSDLTGNFIKACRIMPFQQGSFIIKAQLPRESDLPKPQLHIFNENKILELDNINFNISGILNVVINYVLNGEEDITEEFIIENKNYININILESIKELYSQARITDLDFNLKTEKIEKTFKSSNIVNSNKKRLNSFIEKSKELFLSEENIEFEGFVFECKSKNPTESDNSVEIWCLDTDISKYIKINCKLDTKHYILALDAHKKRKNVKIKAKAVKTATKYTVTELELFEVIS